MVSHDEQRGMLLARELNRRAMGPAPESATSKDAGAAIDQDPADTIAGMAWLIGKQMVREQGGAAVWDPYTDAALELTAEGIRYLEDHPIR